MKQSTATTTAEAHSAGRGVTPDRPVVPAVELVSVTRRFGDVVALANLSLTIAVGEFFSVLGPSGCGKTTLLRLVAGLDAPDVGAVRLGGVDTTRTPAHRRPVNTVFQSYALFPHLDVWDNVAFGLRMKKVPAADVETRVRRVMALVEIEPLSSRRPAELSGGQKQRVALARALVNEPKVLLLDEPLAALDLKLRKQLQVELRQLQRRLGITFICVTHDQDEALVLSDRIAVMRDGRIEQLGAAHDLYERPRTRFVSQFLGSCNLIEARLRTARSGNWIAETALGELHLGPGAQPPASRDTVTLAIRPEKIRLHSGPARPSGDTSALNWIAGRVVERVYVGAETHYEVQAGPQHLRVEVMNADATQSGLGIGETVFAGLPGEALIVLDD